MLVFITGPVRSGKSRFAQTLAHTSGRRVTYIATAQTDARDSEWIHRIEQHRADRPAHWRTFETAEKPFTEIEELFETTSAEELLLIDSLGTWLANILPKIEAPHDVSALEKTLNKQCERFASLFARTQAQVIAVSEETGWGIVPAYPAGRVFRDVLGRFNQLLVERAARSYLIVCGRALELHDAQPVGEPLSL